MVKGDYWVSKASPTLRCSIEILRDIYMYMYVYDCLWETHKKNMYAKMRGQNYVGPNTRMLKVSFRSLKQSADYNFCLEFLIVPLSGRLKPTCDTRIIHFYYTLEQL